jgi:hypothetical protein
VGGEATKLMKNAEIKPFYIDRDGTFMDTTNWVHNSHILNNVIDKGIPLLSEGLVFNSVNKR